MEIYTQLIKKLQNLNQEIRQRHSSMHSCTEQEMKSLAKWSKEIQTDGRRAREYFFDNNPAFKSLRDRVTRAAAKKFLKGLDGRKLYIRNNHAALNTLLQGAGAIVMKKALTILDGLLKLNTIDYKFVANIHDEWQIEVKESQADFVGEMAVRKYLKAGEFYNLRCPLDGEYK